jgi:hypothetical protein
MTAAAEKLAEKALALPEDDRLEIYVQLASSLPQDTSRIAETLRRAEEMRTGKVLPLSFEGFNGKIQDLRQQLS